MSKKDKAPKPLEELAVLPSHEGSFSAIPDDAVELSSRAIQGHAYRKHILNKGILRHPRTGAEINIDDEFFNKLKKNFSDGICDIVQVPLADNQNAHSEDPDRNIGEIVGLEEENDKLYAIVDARRADSQEKMGKTWLGASAMLSTNYTNTKTGERVGPTLLHVLVTNRPYVTGLEDFKEIVAASNSGQDVVVFDTTVPEPAETDEDSVKSAFDVLLSTPQINVDAEMWEALQKKFGEKLGLSTAVQVETDEPEPIADSLIDETLQASTPIEENTMTREELIAALLEEHGIDVEALQARAEEADKATELSNQLAEQLAETLELTDASVSTETLVGAIAEVAHDRAALASRVENLEAAQARHIVKGLVAEGFILPAQEDAMVKLRLSNPETFDELVPSEPLVKLSAMKGQELVSDPAKQELDIDAEISRYVDNVGK